MPRAKQFGDFQRFFEGRYKVEEDFWRARVFSAIAYYGDRRYRAMFAAIKSCVASCDRDPLRFVTALEGAVAADYNRAPGRRRVAAEAWVSRLEELNRSAAAVIEPNVEPARLRPRRSTGQRRASRA